MVDDMLWPKQKLTKVFPFQFSFYFFPLLFSFVYFFLYIKKVTFFLTGKKTALPHATYLLVKLVENLRKDHHNISYNDNKQQDGYTLANV